MSIQSILIIGGGNMGAALAVRWRDDYPDVRLTIAETNADRRASLREDGIDAPEELDFPEEGFDIVVLAIKPQGFADMVPHLSQLIGNAMLISVMAGIPLDALRTVGAADVVRVMPNTPAMIGEGMSAICAPGLSAEKLEIVQALFGAVGRIVMVAEEDQMHAITAISGSGPAYLFAFMEALERGAIAMGIAPEDARLLVRQTVVGSALLAEVSTRDAASLRQQVTSPGGTTEAALKVLNDQGFDKVIREAVEAAQTRSKAMS